MSGFASPYEEDNPFADMQGSSMPVSPPDPNPEPLITSVPSTIEDQKSHESQIASVASKLEQTAPSQAETLSRSTKDSKGSPIKRSGGGGRKPIRASAITSRLQTLDLESDPLGPLGSENIEDSSPMPPPKEEQSGNVQIALPADRTIAGASQVAGSQSETTLSSETEARTPSIPLQQAANPSFSINVGDPTKIGDLTSAHTVYKVSTKTTSQAFKVGEFSVTRRYRDFLWLYEQLNRNCPGVIVPPPPEKQAVGRFSEDFIEARRYALERMLEKTSRHPMLRSDPDFKLFLESESFTAEIKQRPVDQRTAHDSHKGFLGLGSAFTLSHKFVETEEYFDHQRANFDVLDHQLKQLSKAVDIVIRQRKDLASTTAEFGAALSALSTVELSRSLSNALGSLSDLQDKIKQLHERQAQQDLLTLGHTVEEYIRLITSVKAAFSARQKAWLAWQSADTETAKRRSTGDKIRRQARTQQDRLSAVDQEMSESERRAHQLKIEFDNIGKLLKAEIKRFDSDKVEDFKTSVEVFLESAVEAQKEIIEHWEFYSDLLVQDLAEQDDVPVAPLSAVPSHSSTRAQHTQETSTDTAAELQDDILEGTSIEPITPTSAKDTLPSDSAPENVIIPHDEANPFASGSL